MANASTAPIRASGLKPYKEFSTVTLKEDVPYDGRHVRAGSTGTIVSIYKEGLAYEIEFQKPFCCVVTVVSDKIMD